MLKLQFNNAHTALDVITEFLRLNGELSTLDCGKSDLDLGLMILAAMRQPDCPLATFATSYQQTILAQGTDFTVDQLQSSHTFELQHHSRTDRTALNSENLSSGETRGSHKNGPCSHCKGKHDVSSCWILHPEKKEAFLKARKNRFGSKKGKGGPKNGIAKKKQQQKEKQKKNEANAAIVP